MKRRLEIIAMLLLAVACANGQIIVNDSLLRATSPKMLTEENNPLVDFMFTADPTAVEYQGRLYVYGTNDHEQYLNADRNTYEKIRSLVMLSTDDMVNWTYHGTIPTGRIAPWILNSWAPSIVSRREDDGKWHFYLYFSNSGDGVGVVTATSPVGPWKDVLGKPLIRSGMPEIGACPNPFDPGAVIDEHGQGWIAFGGGQTKDSLAWMPGTARVAKLGKDLTSLEGTVAEIKAPYFFEASELNYINGTWVYTYSSNWLPRKVWNYADVERPAICTMPYMTSRTPLRSDSWVYRGDYFRNPGETVPPLTNNHTHLQCYGGKWYLFHHSMYLEKYFPRQGGFRNMGVEEIELDEASVTIRRAAASRTGVRQLKALNPFLLQQAETTAATHNIRFEAGDAPGNMVVCGDGKPGVIRLKGVDFMRIARRFEALVKGEGRIDVRVDAPHGPLIASIDVREKQWKHKRARVSPRITGRHNLYFLFEGKTLRFDNWMFLAE
uniref:Alpha-L-arabinofuranosidase n=1 Tax=Prevotella sp. GTC17259 TaxID=3236795 RepID=A0AB33JEL0_9BACT